MYCRVIVMGRLTSDPELRNTQSNVPVTSFSIAVNRSYTTKTGERPTDFFNIVAWRSQAEFICKYFKKGNCILIDGRLENREFDDRNGVRQRITEIIAENVSFTGEKPVNSQPKPASNVTSFMNDEQQTKANSFSNLDSGSFEELEGDEDLPF